MHRSPLFGESEIHIFHDIAIFIKMLYHLLFILFIVFPLKYLHGFFKMSYFCFEIILERVSVVCCSNVSLAISLRIYRFKFNNSNSRKICKIWLNLTRFTRNVSFLDFKQVSAYWDVSSANTRGWYNIALYVIWSCDVRRMIYNVDATSLNLITNKSWQQFNFTWNIDTYVSQVI